MTKIFSEKTFNVAENITIHCRAENTRSGFRHLATLLETGDKAKETYINRTWERFEFQEVLKTLAGKIGGSHGEKIREYADNYREPNRFGLLGVMAGLADVLVADDPKVRNNGQYAVSGANFYVARGTAPDGAFDDYKLSVAVTDPDSVIISGSTSSGATKIRYGRIALSNAHVSELLDLPVPMLAQYWNGSWLTKTEVVKLAKKWGLPIEKTWSCNLGNWRACGKCNSCLNRKRVFAELKTGLKKSEPLENWIYKYFKWINLGTGMKGKIYNTVVKAKQTFSDDYLHRQVVQRRCMKAGEQVARVIPVAFCHRILGGGEQLVARAMIAAHEIQNAAHVCSP